MFYVYNLFRVMEMRKNMQTATSDEEYKIIAVDDENGILDTLSIFMKRSRLPFYRSY